MAGLRDKKALDKIPADERKLFNHLWSEVAATLKNSEIWTNTPVGPIHEVRQRLVLQGQLDRQNPILVCQVKLAAGKTYVIDMASPNQKTLDPYLVLTDAAGKMLAHDDDSGGGNAQIVFRAEQAGTFRIYATSLQTLGVGPFTLTVREALKALDPYLLLRDADEQQLKQGGPEIDQRLAQKPNTLLLPTPS